MKKKNIYSLLKKNYTPKDSNIIDLCFKMKNTIELKLKLKANGFIINYT